MGTSAGTWDASVQAALDAIDHPVRQRDARTLVELMARVTGEKPRMWGRIFAFGTYHYRYASGREGDSAAAAFAPRKGATVIYCNDGVEHSAELLSALGLRESMSERIVQAESVAQVLQFVVSGGAELGLVALAQLRDRDPRDYWIVPDSLHLPIAQDAVLLRAGAEQVGARAFLDFLRSPEASEVIRAHGYEPPGGEETR